MKKERTYIFVDKFKFSHISDSCGQTYDKWECTSRTRHSCPVFFERRFANGDDAYGYAVFKNDRMEHNE